jgi:hypothetical protein
MQMDQKEGNGHHAVAAGCCIHSEGEKWPSHHLDTALRHQSDQPMILWCRWAARKKRSSCRRGGLPHCQRKRECPSHHLHTDLRHRSDQPRIFWCRMGRKERNGHHATAAGCRILGARDKCPSHHSEAPIRSAKDLMVQMGRQERNGHHAAVAGCRILSEGGNVLHTTFTPI